MTREGQQTEELEPCPFCGKSPEILSDRDVHGVWFFLRCPDKECPAHSIIGQYEEKKVEVFNRWNTRTESGIVKELESAITRLNRDLDAYWNGNRTDSQVMLICDAQSLCREALAKARANGQEPEAPPIKQADELAVRRAAQILYGRMKARINPSWETFSTSADFSQDYLHIIDTARELLNTRPKQELDIEERRRQLYLKFTDEIAAYYKRNPKYGNAAEIGWYLACIATSEIQAQEPKAGEA